MTFDYALYEMSYANHILYSASLPSYRSNREKTDDAINADDPRNAAKLEQFFNNIRN